MKTSTSSPRVYIRRWDHRRLVGAFTAVLQGKRRSGKSVLAKFLMKKTSPNFNGGVLFSGTEKLTPYLGTFMPPHVVHHGLDVEIFKALIHNRVETIGTHNASLSNEEIAQNKANRSWSTLIILEDCLKNFAEWKSIGATFDLFFNGRHADMGLMLLTQEAKCIPPPCRGNVEYLFLFQEVNPRNLDVIYDEYCRFIPRNIFYQLMNDVGKQYHCIVIDMNDKSSNAWQDKVFWYKAENDQSTFRFGSQASWDYSERIVQEKAAAMVANIKKQRQAKREMALWIEKLNGEKERLSQQKPSTGIKRKFSDKYF